MTIPVTTPKVFRYPAIFDSAVNVTLNGAIAPGRNTSYSPQFCAEFFGDAIYVTFGFISYSQGIAPLTILRVKPDGRYCWYSTATSPQNVRRDGNFQTAFFLGPRTLFVSENVLGASAIVTIPNYFVDSGFVHITSDAFSYPAAPCGTIIDNHRIYYGQAKVLIEFLHSFPDDYYLFAGTYTVSNDKFVPVNTGYVGNFANGQDPLVSDLITNQVVAFAYGFQDGTFSYDKYGHMQGGDIGIHGQPGRFWLSADSIVTDGNLNCAGTGGWPSYDLKPSFNFSLLAPVFAGTYMQGHYGQSLTGACNFPACSALAFGESLQFSNGSNFVEIYNIGGMNSVYSNGIIYSFSPAGIGVPWSIYLYHIDESQLPPLDVPPVVPSTPPSHSLLNFHRPVSIIGAYKT